VLKKKKRSWGGGVNAPPSTKGIAGRAARTKVRCGVSLKKGKGRRAKIGILLGLECVSLDREKVKRETGGVKWIRSRGKKGGIGVGKSSKGGPSHDTRKTKLTGAKQKDVDIRQLATEKEKKVNRKKKRGMHLVKRV